MVLQNLIGRYVKWNTTENAEIVEAWVVTSGTKAGLTIVGNECEAWAVLARPCGMLVTSRLDRKELIPKQEAAS